MWTSVKPYSGMMYLAAIEMFTRSMNISTPNQKRRPTISQRVRVGETVTLGTSLGCVGHHAPHASQKFFPSGHTTPQLVQRMLFLYSFRYFGARKTVAPEPSADFVANPWTSLCAGDRVVA